MDFVSIKLIVSGDLPLALRQKKFKSNGNALIVTSKWMHPPRVLTLLERNIVNKWIKQTLRLNGNAVTVTWKWMHPARVLMLPERNIASEWLNCKRRSKAGLMFCVYFSMPDQLLVDSSILMKSRQQKSKESQKTDGPLALDCAPSKSSRLTKKKLSRAMAEVLAR